MNAYDKMEQIGVNNPCAAYIPPREVDDNDSMREMINDSRENNNFNQLLAENNTLNYIYTKIIVYIVDSDDLLATHEQMHPGEIPCVDYMWNFLYTLSNIDRAMAILENVNNIDNMFFLSENRKIISMDFIERYVGPQWDTSALLDRMKKTIDACAPEMHALPNMDNSRELLDPVRWIELHGWPDPHHRADIARQLFM